MSIPQEKGPVMVAEGFKHLRLGKIGDVVLVEILSKEIQGPDLAKEFINELTEAVGQDCNQPVLVDLSRVRYLSSMGYSALFKMVKYAKERQRPIRFCDMHEDVRVGAVAVNMPLVVQIHDSRAAALEAFARG
jgi:anti-anti-sigma regulatory factor